ncbi:ribosome small subunit-dependent GTPase A ['Osedax' symbiont bacterium Rs2_46_30_T18]|nr:ribosome small subunit-dependent GTPase A ['Osedax' symbiont bacterium Rs2_46_30_T18]
MNFSKLQSLGWSNLYLQQLSLTELESLEGASGLFRITAIHRSRITAIGEGGEVSLLCSEQFQPLSAFLAIGDWVLANATNEYYRIVKILEPKNRIQRMVAGKVKVIAANLDYLWIVTSANEDFNINRLQRFLALAHEFSIEPVIILSKMDLCADLDHYLQQLKALNVGAVHAISLHDATSLTQLQSYDLAGTSIALVGSSGVGKSSLINHLLGVGQAVAEIRADDSKGKHTTTHREMFFSKNGLAIIDTPGIRELQLVDSQQGIEQTFANILIFSEQCKFSNCQHQQDLGCAVIAALETGELQPSELANYQKLLREDAFAQRQLLGAHAQRDHDKKFFKMIENHRKEKW